MWKAALFSFPLQLHAAVTSDFCAFSFQAARRLFYGTCSVSIASSHSQMPKLHHLLALDEIRSEPLLKLHLPFAQPHRSRIVHRKKSQLHERSLLVKRNDSDGHPKEGKDTDTLSECARTTNRDCVFMLSMFLLYVCLLTIRKYLHIV